METLEEHMHSYICFDDILSGILYKNNRWIPWICAVLGSFIVGLSGVVPLLIVPDTTPRKTSFSHKDVNYKSPRAQSQADDKSILKRSLSRRQSQFAQTDAVTKEKSLNRYLSFAVGGLLGDICLHLLPEIYSVKIDSSTINEGGHQLSLGLAILMGILSFLAIEKLFDATQVNTKKLPLVSFNGIFLVTTF